MPIESSDMAFYTTIDTEIFVIKMCMTLTFRMGQGFSEQKPVHDFLFGDNSSVYCISDHLRDIHKSNDKSVTFKNETQG